MKIFKIIFLGFNILAVANFAFSQSKVSNVEMVNIKDFGAKGDGVTNDYYAFMKVASYINKNKGGGVFLPKGVYYIENYNTKSSPVSNVNFLNVNGVIIKGEPGTKINVNGQFFRPIDYSSSGFSFSKTLAVTPLSFQNCKNITIESLEIDGNVGKMSRGPKVAESGGHLLKFYDCSGVTLKNLNVHHGQTDGIYIDGSGQTANFYVNNVISANNARQGMSIVQLINGIFKSAKFINTGFTEGAYGNHSPSAGVDIEPTTANGKLQVSNILFDDCLFENNLGSQFVCSSPPMSDNITLKNCRIVASNSKFPNQVILAVKNALVDSCYIDCGSGSIYPVWNTFYGSNTIIKNSSIISSSSGIVAAISNPSNSVSLENNKIIYSGKTVVKTYFPYLQMGNLNFINNKVIIPRQYLKAGFNTLIQKANIASGNFYLDDKGLSFKSKVTFSSTKSVKD